MDGITTEIKKRCTQCAKVHYGQTVLCDACRAKQRKCYLQRKYGKPFDQLTADQKNELNVMKKRGHIELGEPKTCKFCGEKFYGSSQYCSRDCGYSAQAKAMVGLTNNKGYKNEWIKRLHHAIRNKSDKPKDKPALPRRITVEEYFERRARKQFWKQPEVKIPLQICLVDSKQAIEWYAK